MKKYIILLFAFSAACTNMGPRKGNVSPRQDQEAQTRLRQRSDQLARDQREHEMVLKKRKILGGVELRSVPQKQINILEMPTPDNLKKLSDGQLFAEMSDRYQAQDRWGFEVRYRLFVRKYPMNGRIDEAHYMKGLMELAERNYGVALASLNKILKEHPHGKKAPAALFAKGIVYKKMNLKKESKKVLSEVGKQYPGSPESLRAQNELKLLRR